MTDAFAKLFSGLAETMGALGAWASALPAGLEERLGLLAPVVAGAAAALAVAIAMAVYFRSGYRSSRDILRHSFATIVVIGLLAFAAYDMRHAAFDFLGINPAKPAVEFEIRLPKATEFAAIPTDTQVELHTDKNQTLARLDQRFASTDDGRSILKGWVALDFRTTDRVVVLNLPGQTQRLFKLRLAASPTSSQQFSPWHLADQVASASRTDPARGAPNDVFAIRYRVM
jgi:hypothetical protein